MDGGALEGRAALTAPPPAGGARGHRHPGSAGSDQQQQQQEEQASSTGGNNGSIRSTDEDSNNNSISNRCSRRRLASVDVFVDCAEVTNKVSCHHPCIIISPLHALCLLLLLVARMFRLTTGRQEQRWHCHDCCRRLQHDAYP